MQGAIIRGDTTKKKIALVFTGDEFGDGGEPILKTLKRFNAKASFFFTGRFYRNNAFKNVIKNLRKEGHYLGAHSHDHLLYADWAKRDSLLVTKKQFTDDLHKNYEVMEKAGIAKKDAPFFLPPYEWYNDSIAAWTKSFSLQLINYTPGTVSHTDYTTPEAPNYRSSPTIYNSIIDFEKKGSRLNGAILLLHIGTDPKRTDKFYYYLPQLVTRLQQQYKLVRIDGLLRQ